MTTSDNTFSGRTVTVTGGAGLIGSFLVDKLNAAGAAVRVIDDFSKGRRDNIAHHGSAIDVRQGDLEDPAFASEALIDAGVVFHLASRAYGVAYGKDHHLEVLQHNERITNNVLDALARNKPDHLLVTSSSCVYDDNGPDTVPELPLFEGQPETVNLGYGWAKRFLEQKAVIFSGETGVPVTTVRPFNIYGERYNWVGQYSQAIPMLVKRVMDGENPVIIWGSGNQRRSYVHAADCAEMMLAIVSAGHAGDPVNLGTEETTSITELVSLICTVAGLSPAFEYDKSKPEGRFVKSAGMERFASIVPSFTPDVALRDGLERMCGWYRDTFGVASYSSG